MYICIYICKILKDIQMMLKNPFFEYKFFLTLLLGILQSMQ